MYPDDFSMADRHNPVIGGGRSVEGHGKFVRASLPRPVDGDHGVEFGLGIRAQAEFDSDSFARTSWEGGGQACRAFGKGRRRLKNG